MNASNFNKETIDKTLEGNMAAYSSGAIQRGEQLDAIPLSSLSQGEIEAVKVILASEKRDNIVYLTEEEAKRLIEQSEKAKDEGLTGVGGLVVGTSAGIMAFVDEVPDKSNEIASYIESSGDVKIGDKTIQLEDARKLNDKILNSLHETKEAEIGSNDRSNLAAGAINFERKESLVDAHEFEIKSMQLSYFRVRDNISAFEKEVMVGVMSNSDFASDFMKNGVPSYEIHREREGKFEIIIDNAHRKKFNDQFKTMLAALEKMPASEKFMITDPKTEKERQLERDFAECKSDKEKEKVACDYLKGLTSQDKNDTYLNYLHLRVSEKLVRDAEEKDMQYKKLLAQVKEMPARTRDQLLKEFNAGQKDVFYEGTLDSTITQATIEIAERHKAKHRSYAKSASNEKEEVEWEV